MSTVLLVYYQRRAGYVQKRCVYVLAETCLGEAARVRRAPKTVSVSFLRFVGDCFWEGDE